MPLVAAWASELGTIELLNARVPNMRDLPKRRPKCRCDRLIIFDWGTKYYNLNRIPAHLLGPMVKGDDASCHARATCQNSEVRRGGKVTEFETRATGIARGNAAHQTNCMVSTSPGVGVTKLRESWDRYISTTTASFQVRLAWLHSACKGEQHMCDAAKLKIWNSRSQNLECRHDARFATCITGFSIQRGAIWTGGWWVRILGPGPFGPSSVRSGAPPPLREV